MEGVCVSKCVSMGRVCVCVNVRVYVNVLVSVCVCGGCVCVNVCVYGGECGRGGVRETGEYRIKQEDINKYPSVTSHSIHSTPILLSDTHTYVPTTALPFL